MAFVKKSMTGMKDILPKEMELREYLLGIIQSSYKSYGFNRIETPALEDISNLTGGQGGDNEKLIFKILKRGEKLIWLMPDLGMILPYPWQGIMPITAISL